MLDNAMMESFWGATFDTPHNAQRGKTIIVVTNNHSRVGSF